MHKSLGHCPQNGLWLLLHLLLADLPISEELGQRYSTLLMLRKYLYGMTTRSFRRFRRMSESASSFSSPVMPNGA